MIWNHAILLWCLLLTKLMLVINLYMLLDCDFPCCVGGNHEILP